MDMSGEYRIPAARDKVWQALNDPEVLRASIPGCQSLEKVADDQFDARVTAKVGPVKATFNGSVKLSDINPPESYTISGEGKGGAAGFAKGGADVRLKEDGADETVLTYTAKADVGGKLAQLGSRLIDGTAKKMADEFFSNFRDQVTGAGQAAAASVAAAAPAEPAATPGEAEARPAAPATAPAEPVSPAPAAAQAEATRPAAGAPGSAGEGRTGGPTPGFGDTSLQGILQNKLVLAAAAVLVLMILVLLFR